jgi:N-methylhydantoinase A
LDIDAARTAIEKLGHRVGLDVEDAAAAIVRLVDANMTDAVRRVLSLAGADPRKLSLVAFGGMGGVHATTQARELGMTRVVIPRAAAGLSALGLLTANHVIDDSRGYIAQWAEADRAHLGRLARELGDKARAEFAVAGVPESRIQLQWSLLLVYPGQTFDTAINVEDPTDVEAAVAEFHRINAEAPLIESRAQEPMVRGLRLTAVGEVEQANQTTLPSIADIEPLDHRRIHIGGHWHDAAVYDMAAVLPGVTVRGPAAVVSPFTTVILGPGENARAATDGDLIIEIAN